MAVRALLFGSIGTLVETSDLQRRAFNQAFSEAGLDWTWTVDMYKKLLETPGGQTRIADYAAQMEIGVNASDLHQRKTVIFDELLSKEGVLLRAGVADIIHYASEQGIGLGFVTTTSVANINTIFDALCDGLNRDTFEFVGDVSMVSNPKPDPEIYYKALSAMHQDAQNCIAVEDTKNSMQSAIDAGIDCIAFPGALIQTQNFSGASVITDRLSIDHLKPS